MKPMARVYLIVPVYNELGVLQETLQKVLDFDPAYNVVVVDDGSSVPVNIAGLGSRVMLLRHKVNLGQGAAIQTGIDFALLNEADYLITFDADGQHLPEDIPVLLLPILQNKADIVLGSRFLGKTENIPIGRRLLIQVARVVNFCMSGLWMTDAHNGLRAMNRKAADCIRITENRMAHATEILFEIRRNHLRWVEVPVKVLYTDYSIAKGQVSSNGIRILFDIILHKLFK